MHEDSDDEDEDQAVEGDDDEDRVVDDNVKAVEGSAEEVEQGAGSEDGVSSGYDSSDYDDLESDVSDVSDMGVEDAVAEHITRLMSNQRVVRMHMHPGQIVLLNGNTVHAGDAGKPGLWSPRMHVYLQTVRVKNATWPLEAIHEKFAAKFGNWQNER
ncbi:hypothetical protein Vafri_19998 [Volvox africanus]|uniref:Uncharacterized protein n=1 Tax=Volvox africanus TaxID=51714 RepID=A0A8J4BW51_9CHLO|nr:hypothetical protein Vafri_19998 [Volvox africanus]